MNIRILRRIRKITNNLVYSIVNRYKAAGKVKYFCIGRNKTGTTSLKRAFEDLGFLVGNQGKAEFLTGKYYFEGNFQPIIDYCKSAQVFQDVPFSCPETYKYLDAAYPGSKFILTVRDNSEQWYQSITRFHGKLFARDGQIPTSEDLKAVIYAWPDFLYNNVVRLHGTSYEKPYDRDTLMSHYEKYNCDILDYFKDRPDDLLVINIGEQGAYQKFVDFLGVDSPYERFPWENRT